jgi:histidinol-phosphate aminotransferase
LVYVSNPNDVTGVIVGRAELLHFVEAVPESVCIVVDEGSMEYVRATGFPDTIKETEFRRSNLVTLRTFSRAYGLAGLRIGYMAGSPRIISAIQKVQSNYEISSPAQAAAKSSLQDSEELDRRVELNRRSLHDLQHGLDALGLEYYRSYADFLFIKSPDPSTYARELLFRGVLAQSFTGPHQGCAYPWVRRGKSRGHWPPWQASHPPTPICRAENRHQAEICLKLPNAILNL